MKYLFVFFLMFYSAISWSQSNDTSKKNQKNKENINNNRSRLLIPLEDKFKESEKLGNKKIIHNNIKIKSNNLLENESEVNSEDGITEKNKIDGDNLEVLETQNILSKKLINNEFILYFETGKYDIKASDKKMIEDIAINLDTTKRLTIKAYAKLGDENTSVARRLSLSRALAVRGILISKGIENTRINVKALGNDINEGLERDKVRVLIID